MIQGRQCVPPVPDSTPGFLRLSWDELIFSPWLGFLARWPITLMFISRYVLNYLLYVYLLGSYCDVGVGRRVGGRVEGSVRSGVGVGGGGDGLVMSGSLQRP